MNQLQNDILNILDQSRNTRGGVEYPLVMVDYAPICVISNKPMYLFIFCDNGELFTGYTSSKIKNDFLMKKEFKEFIKEIKSNTLNSKLGIDSPNTREIVEVQLLSNNYRKPKAINFITSEFDYLHEISNNMNQLDESARNKVFRYLIDRQISIDSFSYYCPLTDWLRVYTKVPNTVVTDFRLSGKSLLRDAYTSLGGSKQDIDMYTIFDEYGTPEQLTVPVTKDIDEVIQASTINKSGISILNPVYESQSVQYSVTSLGIMIEDIGLGSVSGFDKYPITNNPFADLLLVDYKIFSNKLSDFSQHIYNRKFKAKKIDDTDKIIYEPDISGELSFTQMMEVMKCIQKR